MCEILTFSKRLDLGLKFKGPDTDRRSSVVKRLWPQFFAALLVIFLAD